MIVQSLIIMVFGLLEFAVSLISIPAMPLGVAASLGYALDFMTTPLMVVKEYVGASFFVMVLGLIILLMSIERGWYVIQWIWHKIRG